MEGLEIILYFISSCIGLMFLAIDIDNKPFFKVSIRLIRLAITSVCFYALADFSGLLGFTVEFVRASI